MVLALRAWQLHPAPMPIEVDDPRLNPATADNYNDYHNDYYDDYHNDYYNDYYNDYRNDCHSGHHNDCHADFHNFRKRLSKRQL